MPNETRNRRNIRYKRVYPEGRARAAFFMGIASIVLCVIPVMLVAAVAGLMLEKESERAGYHPMQSPAKVLCVIGTILCSLVIVAIIVLVFVLGVLSR